MSEASASIQPASSAPSGAPAADERGSRRFDTRARFRDGSAFVGGLVDLPRTPEAERRLVLRQALTELARSSSDDAPSPLEGLRPEALASAVKLCLESKLLDELDWLAAGPAGAALYTLASALPPGPEQHELGRRVLSRLLGADAEAFALIATAMARAGGKGLSSPAVVARISLLAELPHAEGVPAGPLALTIASRRELTRLYLRAPSMRSLPERRFAARLVERAAREAAHRAGQGDRAPARLFAEGGSLAEIAARLVADREPLVWRHAAIARGLVAPWCDDGVDALERELGEGYSITEWRRAAAGLGGLGATHPDLALRLAKRAIEGGLFQRDPGATAPLVWGLARAAETEPELAEELYGLLGARAPVDVADAAVWLRRELGATSFADRACARALRNLGSVSPANEGQRVVHRELERELGAPESEDPRLAARVDRAVLLFAREGAAAARSEGVRIVESLGEILAALEAVDSEQSSSVARRTSYAVLRDLDVSVFERGALASLLRLDPRQERVAATEQELESARRRTLMVLLGDEVRAGETDDEAELPMRLARLRTLLHVVDSDPGAGDEDSAEGRRRWQTTARALGGILAGRPHRSLHRALMATFARSLDALVRTAACDVADVLLAAASTLREPRDIDTLAEASMDPDVRRLLWRLAALLRAHRGELPRAMTRGDDSIAPPPDLELARRSAEQSALVSLADELASVGSARADVLHAVLAKLAQALAATGGAASLSALSGEERDAGTLVALENALAGLVQLELGARGRVFDDAPEELRHRNKRALSMAIARYVEADAAPPTPTEIDELAAATSEGIFAPLSSIVDEAVRRVLALPRSVDTTKAESMAVAPADQLPAWLPARRVLGAFYVQRPLGAGAVGSVFAVTRAEDRHDPEAERFALKVPDYNAGAARHLSETEFLAMFRAEATALMAVPAHDNLARFVTFDLAARPKPILVMELVEGADLERLIDTRALDTKTALSVLEQVLSGLAAMHSVDVGHLDLKPSNVILRNGETPVLVDFGLAGRKIRPGCGSPPYAAPEIWGVVPPEHEALAPPADIYAFACLAYEALTGELLFDGDTEAQLLSAHLGHDGLPDKLRSWASDPRLGPLSELLFACLRRDPRQRLGIEELRRELPRATAKLAASSWPLG